MTDSDCDGSLVDEFVDSDGDGDPDCVDDDVDGDGFAADVDCDDSDEDIYPGAVEACDLVDSDCDGSLLDGGESDLDGDGQPDCADTDADGDGVVAGDAPGSTAMILTMKFIQGSPIPVTWKVSTKIATRTSTKIRC